MEVNGARISYGEDEIEAKDRINAAIEDMAGTGRRMWS